MKWTDTREIAIALAEKFPDVDPGRVNFVDLRNWVLQLDGFQPGVFARRLVKVIVNTDITH